MNSTDTYLNRSTDSQLIRDLVNMEAEASQSFYVSPWTTLEYNPFYAGLNRISSDLAKLPFLMFKNLDRGIRGSRELAITHPTLRAIRHQPNPYMGSYIFWRTYFFHAILWSRAFAWPEKNAQNQVVGLHLMPPERTFPVDFQGRRRGEIIQYTDEDGALWYFERDELLDISGLQYSLMDDLVLYHLARETTKQGKAAEGYLSDFMANGLQAGGILEVPPETKPESALNLAEMIESRRKGRAAAFKTMILRDGAKYQQTTITPTDAQLVELKSGQIKDVARWLNMPPSKLGEEPGRYGSREQDARDYLDSTLMPWLAMLQSQAWCRLLSTDAQLRDAYAFDHDVSMMLRPESTEFMAYIKSGIEGGLFSPNEGRAMLNRPPREDPYGDEFFYSNNMQPFSALDAEEQTPEDEGAASNSGEETDEGEEQEDEGRMRFWDHQVLKAQTDLRTKYKWQESRRGDKFVSWFEDQENRLGTARPFTDQLCDLAIALGLDNPEERAAEATTKVIEEFKHD